MKMGPPPDVVAGMDAAVFFNRLAMLMKTNPPAVDGPLAARLANMKVLGLQRAIAEEAGERTGIFTSGVVSTAEGRKIALFFTGRQHAGENLAEVLK